MNKETFTSLRKLNFETEQLVLNFSQAPTFLPVTITAQIRHNYNTPTNFGPGVERIAEPQIQFTLTALPGIFYPADGVDGGVLVRTAWESAAAYIDFSDAKEGPEALNVWFDTNWNMVINTLVYSLLLWTVDHNRRNRMLALEILGMIRDRMEGGWTDAQLAPHGAKGLERLIEASDVTAQHFHIGEYTAGDYSVWLKRRIIGRKTPVLESRWTFVKKSQSPQMAIEDKSTYVITTAIEKKPAGFDDILKLHENHHPSAK